MNSLFVLHDGEINLSNFTWRTRWRILVAKLMIKLGKLTHSDYTAEELNELLADNFPHSFDIEVPAGKGKLTLLQADIVLSAQSPAKVNLLASLDIDALNQPIYRAHLSLQLLAEPEYIEQRKLLRLKRLDVAKITLINDQYALIDSSKGLVDNILPKSLQSLVGSVLKNTVDTLSVGASEIARNYLALYVAGSKQRILDYHQPQIAELLTELNRDEQLTYSLDESDWQEYLFSRMGKDVVIEQQRLRFRF